MKNTWLKKERKKEIRRIVKDAILKHKTKTSFTRISIPKIKQSFPKLICPSLIFPTCSSEVDTGIWRPGDGYAFGVDLAEGKDGS